MKVGEDQCRRAIRIATTDGRVHSRMGFRHGRTAISPGLLTSFPGNCGHRFRFGGGLVPGLVVFGGRAPLRGDGPWRDVAVVAALLLFAFFWRQIDNWPAYPLRFSAIGSVAVLLGSSALLAIGVVFGRGRAFGQVVPGPRGLCPAVGLARMGWHGRRWGASVRFPLRGGRHRTRGGDVLRGVSPRLANRVSAVA